MRPILPPVSRAIFALRGCILQMRIAEAARLSGHEWTSSNINPEGFGHAAFLGASA
jgi:hypothetical protein